MRYPLLTFLLLGLLAASRPSRAQMSGNQVTGRRYQQADEGAGSPAALLPDRLALTDSTFLIAANVMQHVRADRYVAVFGLRQEARTVPAAEKRMAARVQRFTTRLRRLDVDADGIYTDVVAQTQVHDIRTGTLAEEYLRGFELTRNVIVPFRRAETMNELLLAAAADSIYDLVKVDYVVSDPEAVYANLFKAASEVIGRKKSNYLTLTGAQLRPAAQPYAEVFSTFVPGGQYKSYQATVKADYYDVDQYGNQRRHFKTMPALTTYYYQAPGTSGFDRVINPVVTEPVVTFTLALQVKYTLQKPARR